MAQVSISKARTHMAEIVGRVQYGNERIALEKHGKIVAGIVPVEDVELLERLEDMALGELVRERLEEYERTGESFSHEEVFGRPE